MNVPPAILDLRVASTERKPFHLWLPLFLLWPLLLALGVVALVLTLLVDIVLLVIGERYHRYTLLLFRCFEALTESRGMVVRVHNSDGVLDLALW